ncbi:DNA replication licensing factor MCM3-like [Daucus carota subsp. sativus]|uniref:DNA replication licensing factor MCM3-like n=1 Tax=Daucus carota subsp. sativus TaxID=79200 RepID=UPI003082E690
MCVYDVQASDHIATAYAELRNASSSVKTGGGTLPITARTLKTIIRLSTAHAKLKLSRQVPVSAVEAALKVLNFAIYHEQLTEMEEHHEQEREKESESKCKADHDAGRNVRSDLGGASAGGSASEAMEIDDPPEVRHVTDISADRFVFSSISFLAAVIYHMNDMLLQPELQRIYWLYGILSFCSVPCLHMHAQHLEHISIGYVQGVVNNQAAAHYSRAEIMLLLEKCRMKAS